MRSSRPTSARRGTLSRIKVSAVRRLAIISGKVAFFAPEIGMVPWSGRPPTIRMRSIFSAPAARRGPTRSAAYFPARIAAKVGSGPDIGIGGRHILGLAAARLLLAPLEVFPQARRQPRAPRRPFLGFAGFDHGGHLKACRRIVRNKRRHGWAPGHDAVGKRPDALARIPPIWQ